MTNPSNPPRRLKINHGPRTQPGQQPANQQGGIPRQGDGYVRQNATGPVNRQITLPYGALKQNQRDKLDRESVDFHSVICSDKVNRINESMFVMEMLPFLFGEVPDFVKDNPESEMTAAKWIAAAGGPHAEFDVIDDNTREVLFRVPAFVNRELYDMKAAASKGRFNNMFNFAKQLSHLSPNQAAAFTEYQFTDRGKSNDRLAIVQVIQDRWNAIFARYDRPTLTFSRDDDAPVLNTTPASKTTATAAGGSVKELESPQDHKNDGFYY